MSRKTWSLSILILSIAVGGAALFFATNAAASGPGLSCQHQGVCIGSGCVPIPTSLPTANGGPVGGGGSGWAPNGGACGTKSCYIVLRCPCGSPLSTQWCDGCEWPPPCV